MFVLHLLLGFTQIIGTCQAAASMDKALQDYAVPIGVGVGVAAVALLGVVCFTCSNSKSDSSGKSKSKSVKRQGSIKVKTGSVSEMAEAFDKASSDRSPVITGRQKVRQRVKDDVFQ